MNHPHMLRAMRQPSTRRCFCSIPLAAVLQPYGAEQSLQSQQIALARSLVSHVLNCSGNIARGPLCICVDVRQCTRVEVREFRATASWALHVEPELLVDALHVKIVSTRQTSPITDSESFTLINKHTDSTKIDLPRFQHETPPSVLDTHLFPSSFNSPIWDSKSTMSTKPI